jgi:hypothetical protein
MVLALKEEACVMASLMITMPVLMTRVFFIPLLQSTKTPIRLSFIIFLTISVVKRVSRSKTVNQ